MPGPKKNNYKTPFHLSINKYFVNNTSQMFYENKVFLHKQKVSI